MNSIPTWRPKPRLLAFPACDSLFDIGSVRRDGIKDWFSTQSLELLKLKLPSMSDLIRCLLLSTWPLFNVTFSSHNSIIQCMIHL